MTVWHRSIPQAQRDDANNVRRVIRAIEIYETTGITKTEWDRRSVAAESPYDARVFVLAALRTASFSVEGSTAVSI